MTWLAKLSINGHEFNFSTISDFRHEIEAVNQHQFLDIWVRHQDGQTLSMLSHDNQAWLMCLEFEGDPGFHSYNPEYDGPEDANQLFLLSNGQMDTYPLRWTLATSEALKAIEYFLANRSRPPWIVWKSDR